MDKNAFCQEEKFDFINIPLANSLEMNREDDESSVFTLYSDPQPIETADFPLNSSAKNSKSESSSSVKESLSNVKKPQASSGKLSERVGSHDNSKKYSDSDSKKDTDEEIENDGNISNVSETKNINVSQENLRSKCCCLCLLL